MIHLDTSFLVLGLAPDTPESVLLDTWVAAGEPLGMSAIAWTELLCGPLTERDADLAIAILGSPEPYLEQDAAAAARLYNTTGRRRGSLADCMIAAAAIRLGATLATANPRDFRRFEAAGLELVSS